MSTTTNKFGLSRTISSDLKRKIRKKCGYGCVICGHAWYDYEHFNPDYKDAKEHKEEGITLLCMQCNQKRNRGVLSVDTVSKANSNPKCLSDGHASERFDLLSNKLEIIFSGSSFTDCENVIMIGDISLFSINKKNDGTFTISGRFFNSDAKESFVIKDNNWDVNIENWDVECKGNKIIVREGPGNISLRLRLEPPSRIVVEKINMKYRDVILKGDESELKISKNNGESWNVIIGNNSFEGLKTGIFIESKPKSIVLSLILCKLLLKM